MGLDRWQNECLDLREILEMLDVCIKSVNGFEEADDTKPILVNLQRVRDAAENAFIKRKTPKAN